MKRRFSKILGVGLTLALLTSLLLTAAPVAAISTPAVTFTPTADAEISTTDAGYVISFRIDDELVTTDKIVVTFPTGTGVASPTATITAWSTLADGSVLLERTLDTTETIVDTLTVELTWATHTITTLGTVQVEFTAGITNPDDAGVYNLTVETRKTDDTVIEAAVTSADYTIIEPTLPVLPGIVQQFNAVGTPMDQATGDNAIFDMLATAGDNYTIVVGPGTYIMGGAKQLVISQEGLTLKSSAGAEDTVIDAATSSVFIAIKITGDDVIVDGFTIESDAKVISIWGSDGAVVRNNIITVEGTEEVGIAAEASATDITISGNTVDNATIYLSSGLGSTVSGNTGNTINISTGFSDNVITGNILTDIVSRGIVFNGEAGTHLDNLIEGNILSSNTRYGIHVENISSNDPTITNLTITGNTITDNEEVGILIDSGVVWGDGNTIKFNTITGNTDYGIQNDSAVDVDATFNWWGTTVAADIADMVGGTGDVTTEPFLADTAEAVLSVSDATATASALDAKTTVGVRVSVADEAGDSEVATTISVAKYIANPEAAIAGAIAFYDVYVVGTTAPTTDLVTIKFYAGDANTAVYLWSADTDMWVPVDADFSTYGGYVYVTVTADVLGGTPFALVAGAAEPILAPDILAPVTGDDTVSLTPVFAWEAVPGADGYYFELADNANFVLPLVSLTGDLGRLIVTAYAYVGELPYSTPYYWRVKAVDGTVEAGDLAESDWVSGLFITKDEPEEPTPPVVIEETEPPVIVIEQPDIIVPLPAETPITPAWIYVIIAVGAVLVIALLVLIVRTRRVA